MEVIARCNEAMGMKTLCVTKTAQPGIMKWECCDR